MMQSRWQVNKASDESNQILNDLNQQKLKDLNEKSFTRQKTFNPEKTQKYDQQFIRGGMYLDSVREDSLHPSEYSQVSYEDYSKSKNDGYISINNNKKKIGDSQTSLNTQSLVFSK